MDWAAELLPELDEPRNVPGIEWPLPAVACAIANQRAVPGLVAQREDYLRGVVLLVAVRPEPHDVASEELHGFIDTLMNGIITDTTLRGRIARVEPEGGRLAEASFDVELVPMDDGGAARAASLSFTIRDTVAA